MDLKQIAIGLVDAYEALFSGLSRAVSLSSSQLVDIESIDDDNTITFKDGSLMSIIRLHGSFRMVGADEFVDIHSRLSKSLKAYMGNGGHSLLVYVSVDPDSARRDIEEAQKHSRATANRLGLDLDDLFEEDVRHLAKYCSNEKVFFALITRPSALSSAEQKQDQKAKQELLLKHPIPRLKNAPNLFAAMRGLRTRHASFVSALLIDLKEVNLAAELLDVHQAFHDQRMSVDPEFTDETWRPRLPGDRIPVREDRRDPKDMSGHYWPKVGSQLMPRDAEKLDSRTVAVGDRSYAPMFVDLFPREIEPFQKLFARVRDSRIPWRMAFLIESKGLSQLLFKDLFNFIVKWTNSDNAMIKRSSDEVKRLVKEEGELDVTYRIDFATWAPREDRALLSRRASSLARAVEGWGGIEVKEMSGDVFRGFISSCLALSLRSVANKSCAVLNDAIIMLPINRPASPWMDGGAVLYRTPDGKVWPYQPNSPIQSSWITIMVAEPRSGKSVNGNQVNLGLCLSPGIVRLPLIAIIDVGKSSSGLISLLQYALPEGQRHMAVSIRLRMTPDYCINVFDTQLGCRYPLPHEEAFLVNFLSMLVTPVGKSAPADGMLGLVKMAIQEAYKYYADNRNAKPYSPNTEGAEKVDQAISDYALHIDAQTTWWEIVDALYEKGATHAAMLAQRYAVPLLADIASLSREPQFQDMYGSKITEGEPLLSAFARMISESIRAYPILKSPTRFDLGDARVVSFDLDEVAKGGSPAADHQAGVCYLLARYVSARNFYLIEDHIQNFPPQYRQYHEKRIHEIRQDKKHLQYDEFHRTKMLQPVRDQVVGDMREGGKWGIMVSLISQSITDYDAHMLEFATCKIVVSKQNEVNAEEMRKLFNLTPTAKYAVMNGIRPPGPHGSTFFGQFATKRGEAMHLLNNTIGGIKLWAFSTSSEDTYVRDALYRRIGPKCTRQLMARLYPGGSISDEVERRKLKKGDAGIDAKDDDVIEELIEDILSKFETLQKEGVM